MTDKPKEGSSKDLWTVPAHCRFLSFVLIVATLVFGCLIFTSITPPEFWGYLVPWRRFFLVFILANVVWFYSLGLIYAKDKRQFKARRFNGIVTLICLLIMFGLGWCMNPVALADDSLSAAPGIQPHINLMDVIVDSAFYLSVLLNAGWFFYLLAPLVREQILNAILFMVLFVWGCVLYYCFPVDDSVLSRDKVERQIEAPNRTVAAFFPSRGGFETVAKDNNNEKTDQRSAPKEMPAKDDANGLRLHYFLFHTSVLFYVALITFSIFGRGIVNGVRKWLTFWKRLNVFWGRSDAGLLLARSIVTTTDSDEVFFMLQQKSGDGDEWRTLTRDIDDMDGMWSFTYDSNAVETDVSKDKLSQAKGRRHFFMDESGHVNVSMADRIVKILRNQRPRLGINGFWNAFRAGMFVRWFVDSKRWWRYNDGEEFPKVKGTFCRRLLHHVKVVSRHPRFLWKLFRDRGKYGNLRAKWFGARRGLWGRYLHHFEIWYRHPKYLWRLLWMDTDRKSKCRQRVDAWAKPFLYVRIEASADELVFQSWAVNVRDVVTPVLVRESQLIAKDFINKYPLLEMPGIKVDNAKCLVSEGDFNILLIGFGSVGQDVLTEIVCNGQFVQSYAAGKPVQVRLHVDIVEQDNKVIEEYCIRHPLATRHPRFSAQDQDECFDVNFVLPDKTSEDNSSVNDKVRVEDKTFDDWFRSRLEYKDKEGNTIKRNPYNRIIVCLKGDDKTLGIANKIVEFARRQGVEIGANVVFARVKDPARNRYLPQGRICSCHTRSHQPDPVSNITLFGDLKDIYAFCRINVETVDTMAKVLNSRYGDCGNKLADVAKREAKWCDASFFDQLSSRAAAEGQRNILMLLGLAYCRLGESKSIAKLPGEIKDMLNDENSSVLRTLAINEHLRWNAFHIMMGYRPWKVRVCDRKGMEPDARKDLPEPKPGKIRANQLATIGKHADIVPFDTLPEIDMLLEEWNTGHAPPQSERWKFEGLRAGSSQAWDIGFCQIVDEVAEAAGLSIVRRRPKA